MVSCRQPGFPMYAGVSYVWRGLPVSSRVFHVPLGLPRMPALSPCPSWSPCPSGSNVCRGFPCISRSPVSRVCLVSYICKHFPHLPIRSHYGLPRETFRDWCTGIYLQSAATCRVYNITVCLPQPPEHTYLGAAFPDCTRHRETFRDCCYCCAWEVTPS